MIAAAFTVRRLVLVGAIAFTLLLVSGSDAQAGGRAFRAWTEFMTAIERVCKDGIRLGIADTYGHKHALVFVIEGQGEPTLTSPRVGGKEEIVLDEKEPDGPDGSFPNVYCTPVPENSNGFDVNFCKGTIPVLWNRQLAVGDRLDLYVYRFDENNDEYVQHDDNTFPLGDDLVVSDCTVDDIETGVVQTGPNTTATTVSKALVFQARAFDPNWGSSDGDGIKNVQMSLVQPNGTTVYERTEFGPAYCLFGGNNPCVTWVFEDHGNRWPNGQPIQSGRLLLRATANRHDGGSETVTAEVDIRLPGRSLYLPFIQR